MIMYVKIIAKKDIYGNPRRAFIVYEIEVNSDGKSKLVGVIDEGYDGNAVLFEKFPEAIHLCNVSVSVSEYNEWIKRGEKLSK